MNPFNVSIVGGASGAARAPDHAHNQSRAQPAWSQGQTITAIFESVNGRTATLRTADGFSFTADASAIQGRVGDELRFSVERTGQGLSLRQIIDNPNSPKAERGFATTLDAYRGAINTIETIQETEELREEHRQEHAAKIARAIASIRRAQSFMSGVGRQNAVSAMIESGLDISKVSFAELKQVMQSVDRTPEREMTEAELAEGMDRKFANKDNAQNIVESLYNNGLEVSDKNVKTLEGAYEKLPEKVEPPAIAKLIEAEEDLTLDNVYKSKYQANYAKTPAAPPAPWDALQEAVAKLFEREGITPTPENLNAAKFLLDRNLPITRSNVERVIFLEGMSGNIPKEAFFNHAASFMAQDRPVGSMSLPDVARLAEIQLMVMSKVALKHQSLGIDTEPLRAAVRTYNLLESDAERYLRMVGGDLNPITTGRMTSLFERLAEINPHTVNVHGNILKGNQPFTIEAVHKSVLHARANAEYEQYATVPNPRYGDSFARVKNLFAPLLEGMNIRPTNENLKASFILSKNEMDVNKDNLAAVKEIEAKINSLASKLHPVIAASMVKDGLNPLAMHVDQVLAYIKKFNKGKGNDDASKLAEHIMEMDGKGSIDADTRKSMIAMYRMLNVIRKDGASALGLAAEMGTSLTLGELMEMSKNFKQIRKGEAVNISVDESFGELESIVRPEGSIRGAIENTAAPTHMDVVLEGVVDAVKPDAVPGMMDQALEDIASNPPPAEATKAMDSVMDSHIQTFLAANPEVVHFLQSRNIAATAGHIRALDKLTGSHRALADEIEELEEDVLDAIPDSSLKELQDEGSVGRILSRILDAITSMLPGRKTENAKSLLSATHGLNGDEEKGFQIPVKINGRVSNLQVYVMNERALTDNGARILLSLDTGSLGIVTTYFTMSNGAIDAVVSASTPEGIDALYANKEELLGFLNEAGVGLNSLEILLEREAALETSLPPDAIEQWATDSPEVKSLTQSAYDYRV